MRTTIFKNLTALFVAILFVAFIPKVEAFTTITRSELNLDDQLGLNQEAESAEPKQMLITHVKAVNPVETNDPSDQIDYLYYYFITRLHFGDLPFNFIVDRDGNVFQIKEGWEGVNPGLENYNGEILIGYLSSSTDISIAANSSLGELVEGISFKYGINRDSTRTVEVSMDKSADEKALSKLAYADSGSAFANEVNKTLASVNFSNVSNLVYKGVVKDLSYSKEVKSGDKLSVTMKLENQSDFPWFTTKDFIYMGTSDGKDSPFAVNGVWDSFSKPLHISDQTIKPGESVDVTFDMQAQLLPGAQSQGFRFTKLDGKAVEGTDFSVEFTITKGDSLLLQILPTDTGYVNVRECGGLNCKVVGKVDVGKIYVYTEEVSGWFKVKYAEGAEGWIVTRYAKKL